MAGFSRAPSAWKMTFLGMNLKDAPDQIQPVQYPMAVNIRGLADHSIRTRPGYEFYFNAAGGDVPPIDTGGITAAWFECVLDNEFGDAEGVCQLQDLENNIYGEVTVETRTTYKRVRVDIDPDDLPEDAWLLPVLLTNADGLSFSCYERRFGFTVEFDNGFKAEIVLEMGEMLVGASDSFDTALTSFARHFVKADYENNNCEFHWPMATGDFGSGGGNVTSAIEDYWSYFDYVRTITYGSPAGDTGGNTGNNTGTNIWVYDPTKYATLDSIRLELSIAVADDYDGDDGPINTGAIVGFAALYDKTDNVIVADTETTWTNPYPEIQSIDVPLANLVAGHEYWVQYKIEYDGDVDDLQTDGMTLYNITLIPKTSDTTLALVPQKYGNYIGGFTSGPPVFNTTVRSLFQSAPWPDGTVFTFEMSGQIRLGTGCDVSMLIADTADYGFPLVSKSPTTATIVTGSWMNEADALGGSLSASWLTLSIALETGILEFGDCGFVSGDFPASASINSIVVLLQSEGIIGQSARWTTYARISGVDENLHNGSFHLNSDIANPSPPPTDVAIMSSESFNLINDRSWVIADLLDADFVVRVRANQPNNATSTTFFLGGVINAMVVQVGYGTDLADSSITINSAATVQARVVSDPITPVDGIRYFLHFASDSGNNIRHSVGLLVAEVAVTP